MKISLEFIDCESGNTVLKTDKLKAIPRINEGILINGIDYNVEEVRHILDNVIKMGCEYLEHRVALDVSRLD